MINTTARHLLKQPLKVKKSKVYVIYQTYQVVKLETCPECAGKKTFKHKNYEYNCMKCCGTGQISIHNFIYQYTQINWDLTKFNITNLKIELNPHGEQIYGFCETRQEAEKLCQKLEKEKSNELLEEEK